MRIANVVLPGWGEKGQTPADEVRLSGATLRDRRDCGRPPSHTGQ